MRISAARVVAPTHQPMPHRPAARQLLPLSTTTRHPTLVVTLAARQQPTTITLAAPLTAAHRQLSSVVLVSATPVAEPLAGSYLWIVIRVF